MVLLLSTVSILSQIKSNPGTVRVQNPSRNRAVSQECESTLWQLTKWLAFDPVNWGGWGGRTMFTMKTNQWWTKFSFRGYERPWVFVAPPKDCSDHRYQVWNVPKSIFNSFHDISFAISVQITAVAHPAIFQPDISRNILPLVHYLLLLLNWPLFDKSKFAVLSALYGSLSLIDRSFSSFYWPHTILDFDS